jgi:membrane protease YdiL (CAAX protease family)
MNEMQEDEIQPPPLPVLWLALIFEGGLGLAAWLLGWVFDQPPLRDLRWDGRAVGLGVAATVPMLVIFFACLRWPVGPLARIKQISDELIRPLFASCSPLELALVALVAGIGEEMLFRGFLQNLLSARFGWWAGWVITSLLFGLMHPITAAYVVLAAGLGLYLGWVWAAAGNLLTVIIAHGLYDFIALVYLVQRAP